MPVEGGEVVDRSPPMAPPIPRTPRPALLQLLAGNSNANDSDAEAQVVQEMQHVLDAQHILGARYSVRTRRQSGERGQG